MSTIQTAKRKSHGNGITFEEALSEQKRIQRDINLYPGIKGYLYAFKRDSVMTFEKYENQKNNGRLGGEF